MKRCAKGVSRRALGVCLAAVMCLAVLPGCAVVGPVLSIGGMAGLAPLQYASTALTVGEFSYEYAVNDKDPSEVIEAKIDDILSGKAFKLPEFIPGAEALNNGFADDPALAEADAESVAPALTAQARRDRIERILGRRTLELRRMEQRRLAFFSSARHDQLSLHAAATSAPSLRTGYGETTLR